MVIVIFVSLVFLRFSLDFATMALISARNYRLECEEGQETEDHFTREPSPVPRFNRSLPARQQASGASCLLTPGS